MMIKRGRRRGGETSGGIGSLLEFGEEEGRAELKAGWSG
jgi:hypothetical protein